MGSWNHTCMLSRLHVTYNDPVVAFFCVQNRYNKTFEPLVYSDDLFRPIPVPLYGVYDDYGGVEVSPESHIDILVSAISANLVEREQGENEYHDIPVKREGLTIEKLFEADHEGRLAVSTHAGEAEVRHVVILRSLYDRILSDYYTMEYEIGVGSKKVFFKDITANLEDQVTAIRKRFERRVITDEDLKGGMTPELMDALRSLSDYDFNNHWEREITKAETPLLSFLPYKNLSMHFSVLDQIRELPFDDAVIFCRRLAEATWMRIYADRTRTPWLMMPGQGSQSQSIHGYEIMAGFLTDFCATARAEDEDEEE